MNKVEQENSISALGACLTLLRFPMRLGSKHTASARVRHAEQPILPGEIEVHFALLDITNGPEISCDPDIMKGYRIPFGDFKPWFQRFSFDSSTSELRITSVNTINSYDFLFCF